MKTAVEITPCPTRIKIVQERKFTCFLELTKPRLTLLAVAMTMLGCCLGANGSLTFGLALATLSGAALVGAGAAALNQFLEREADGRMHRTQSRPLPSGRMQPGEALAFGICCAVAGLLELMLLVNPLTGLLGVVCLGSYLFVYTPLKQKTPWSTLVGAVPGAIPPLMGWAAVRGQLDPGGWVLFLIVFFWQMPHFLAIAWLYKEDYARGGFRVLPVVDPGGARAVRQIRIFSVALLLVSLTPAWLGMSGNAYLACALPAGVAFLVPGFRFAATKSRAHARWLFLASVIYLPVLGMLLVLLRR